MVLGNLTGRLAKIKPAVADVSMQGDRSSKNDAFVQMVAEDHVKRTVNDIRAKSPVLKAMADAGEIRIVRAMLDIQTGAVTWYQRKKFAESRLRFCSSRTAALFIWSNSFFLENPLNMGLGRV